METYSYTAVAKDGKDKKGQIEAETRDDAARKLKELGLTPMAIKQQSALDKDIEIPFLTKKKVKPRDMSVFCRQFASILNAGVSVVNALEMLAEQTENKDLKKAIMDAQSGVEKGETLSDSMRQDSGIFPSILIDMVKAGESSGSLENALTRMAIQFEKQAKTQGIVKKAMMYPMVLLVVMVGVIIVMLTFVIPNFVSMFEDLDSELPFMTKAVLAMSDAVMNYWYIIIAVIAAIVVGYKMYVKTDAGRHSVDTLMKAKSGVALGLPLSNQLKATQIFPPMIVHMVGIGEETGNIEEMLTNSAGYYEEEVEVQTQTLTALMEPAIIVVMALVVVVLILSIYQPMIQLYNTLG